MPGVGLARVARVWRGSGVSGALMSLMKGLELMFPALGATSPGDCRCPRRTSGPGRLGFIVAGRPLST